MTRLYLTIELLSDTTFGRGEGTASLVDVEIDHDEKTGLPYINGRRLKGLLVEECAEVLYATGSPDVLVHAAAGLFGITGSTAESEGQIRIGRAEIASISIQQVAQAISAGQVTSAEIFGALTAVRTQTAVDTISGAPKKGSLRTMRVLVRTTKFTAPLDLLSDDPAFNRTATALLAACAAALRRVGGGRNRGRGHICAVLGSPTEHERYLVEFAALIGASK